MAEKYKSLEQKKPIKVKNKSIFKDKTYTVLENDLLHENTFIRHSYGKIGKVVDKLVRALIK